MIVKAATIIQDKRQNKRIIIPCMRHGDVFFILKQFGYQKIADYEEIEQGFLDEHNNFYNRIEAHKHAYSCGQIHNATVTELYSEDLW